MPPINELANANNINQGVAHRLEPQWYRKCPLGAAAILPAGSHADRIGSSGTLSSLLKPITFDTADHINILSTQQLAGLMPSSPGRAVASSQSAVQAAACYYKPSTAVASSTAATVPCMTSNFGATTGPVAAAGFQQNSTASVESTSVPQRTCTNCGTDSCCANTWRTGPAGRKTLCNACGLRYKRHGAGRLNLGSRAAMAATPELAAPPVADLAKGHPQLSCASSTSNNYGGIPAYSAAGTAPAPAALPAAVVNSRHNSSSLSAAAASVQDKPTLPPHSSAAQQTTIPCNIRRSKRERKPKVLYEELDSLRLAMIARVKQSSAATTGGSMTQRSRRLKRLRDASGEAELPHPGKVTKAAKVASSSAASAAVGGVPQAYPAAAVELMELDVLDLDVRAEAVRLLSTVAPRASDVRVRKSYRVAHRQAQQFVALKEAAEAEEAAEALLAMAGVLLGGWFRKCSERTG